MCVYLRNKKEGNFLSKVKLETRETIHFPNFLSPLVRQNISVSTQPTKVNWDGINNYRKDQQVLAYLKLDGIFINLTIKRKTIYPLIQLSSHIKSSLSVYMPFKTKN